MRIVILGNGITGATAARRLRELRPDWEITLVSGESRFPYSRPALMYVFMGHMRYADTKPWPDEVWERDRIELVQAWVHVVDLERKRLRLAPGASNGASELAFDRLLIATGSRPNEFGWPGQDLAGVQGLYGLHDLKLLYENCAGARRAVIVGGGLIGIELAEMLHHVGVSVTLLVRESSYWNNVLPPEESEMVNRVIRAEGFDLRLGSELEEIVDGGDGRVAAVTTKAGERIDCELVGLTAGVRPNVGLLEDTAVELGRGVLVDEALRTSVADVFAAGDCAEIVRSDGSRLLQQVWYTGKRQGEVAALALAGEDASYEPGIWYNSAKFLDLEYQTYGRVNFGVEGEESLYWEDPDGLHAVRLVHVAGRLIGVNVMGLRWRHEVCERWIREAAPLEHVLEHIEEAHFDPELFRRHSDAIRGALRAEPA